MRAEAGVGSVRKGRMSPVRGGRLAVVRRAGKIALAVLAVVVVAVLAIGFAYAGSPDVVADGVKVSGVGIGGLDAQQADSRLSARAQALAAQPVVFAGAGRRWSIAPAQLAVRGDWEAAAQTALGRGDGSVPLRGVKRLEVRLFGSDVTPQATADQAAL